MVAHLQAEAGGHGTPLGERVVAGAIALQACQPYRGGAVGGRCATGYEEPPVGQHDDVGAAGDVAAEAEAAQAAIGERAVVLAVGAVPEDEGVAPRVPTTTALPSG